MNKFVSNLLSLLLLLSGVGYNYEWPQDGSERRALGGLAAPPQSHETANLVAQDHATRKTGSSKESLIAILDVRNLGGQLQWLRGIWTPDSASNPTSPAFGVNSVRAPPVSVLAF